MDFGIVLLVGFFGWLAWLMLRSKPGAPMVCVTCNHHGPTKTATKGSIWIEVILWLCFIIPGLIYSVWRHSSRKPVCSSCGSETLVPENSPVGKKILASNG